MDMAFVYIFVETQTLAISRNDVGCIAYLI